MPFLSSLDTSPVNVNAMFIIFCHDISEMFFSKISLLPLPLLSINTNHTVHLLVSQVKSRQEDLAHLQKQGNPILFISFSMRPKVPESLH